MVKVILKNATSIIIKPMNKVTKNKININNLKLWDKNPRSIDKKGFARLVAQLKRVKEITGEYLYKPLTITQDNIVIGGNMRLRALQELGETQVWVEVVRVKNEQEMIEVALIDNDEAGKYEKDLTLALIEAYPEIKLSDYAVSFDAPTTLQDFMAQFKPIEEDEVPDLDAGEAVSQVGEVYQLGRHRLMCGDATKIEDVEKLMDGQKADMVFTDPPYNVAIKGKFTGEIKNDDLSEEDFKALLEMSFNNLSAFNKGSYYICYEVKQHSLVEPYVTKIGLIDEIIVWNKDSASFYSKNKYNRKFEAMFFIKGNGLLDCNGEVNVWDFPKSSSFNSNDENGKKFNQVGNFLVAHPTTKPIALIKRALNNSSKQDDIVLDLFGGSGSTLIACEQTNRTCYMMELDPKYCDVIRKRYENFTNKT